MLFVSLFLGVLGEGKGLYIFSHTASAREDTTSSMAKMGMLRCSCVLKNVSNLNDDLSI